jgi:transposase InsO family protein
MDDFGFIPLEPGIAPSVGSVLRLVAGSNQQFLRISHLFERNAYVMQVSSPEGARDASKPRRVTVAQMNSWLQDGTAIHGRLPLPSEFLDAATTTDEAEIAFRTSLLAWIAPLIAQFDNERTLAGREFKARVCARAKELQVSETTLRRLLLRYYYFGRLPAALTQLRPGRSPHKGPLPAAPPHTARKRPGPKAVLEKKLGPNDFIVEREDIEDMVASVTTSVKAGRSTITQGWEDYLRKGGPFEARHPELHRRFVEKACPCPVSYAQFRGYVQTEGQYSDEVMAGMPSLNPLRASARALLASGPGEIAEIDATGGRIFIVDSETGAEIGKPWIYVLIDRWSRFVLGIYVTANAPSWEELKQVLLVGFTARDKRFEPLGIHVDENRWPIGRVPSVIVQDRGAEFMSNNMATAAVDNLRIELKTAPPRCPDAKGIVERLIRELKQLLVAEGMKGAFTKRVMDYETKLKAKKAKAAAAHSLVDVYRALVRVVDKHNNRPHRTLEKYNVLRAAGIPPTPREAYLWGLTNLTGMRSPPLTDDDYFRLLLTTGQGSLANGLLNFEGRSYFAVNEPAQRLARASTRKHKPIEVRFDRLERPEIHVAMPEGPWARWRMTERDLQSAHGITLEDEHMKASKSKLIVAESRNDALIDAVVQPKMGKMPRMPTNREPSSREDVAAMRKKESENLKRAFSGKSSAKVANKPARTSKKTAAEGVNKTPSWQELERQERAQSILKARDKLRGRGQS